MRGAPLARGSAKAGAGRRAKYMIGEGKLVRRMAFLVSKEIMRAGRRRGPLRRPWTVSGAGRGIRTPVSRGTWD